MESGAKQHDVPVDLDARFLFRRFHVGDGDVTEVRDGYECGIGLGSFNDIKPEDVIETFEEQEVPRG